MTNHLMVETFFFFLHFILQKPAFTVFSMVFIVKYTLTMINNPNPYIYVTQTPYLFFLAQAGSLHLTHVNPDQQHE